MFIHLFKNTGKTLILFLETELKTKLEGNNTYIFNHHLYTLSVDNY